MVYQINYIGQDNVLNFVLYPRSIYYILFPEKRHDHHRKSR